MMLRRLRRDRCGFDPRRGVAFVWFTVVAMPFLFLALAFASDFTRIVMTTHTMRNAANAAAAAGAWEFAPGSAVLDQKRASDTARDTMCMATQDLDGIASVAGVDGCPTVQVWLTDWRESPDGVQPGGFSTIVVRAQYRIVDTIFFSYFGVDKTFLARPVTESATVCVPGQVDGYTSGNCARPGRPTR